MKSILKRLAVIALVLLGLVYFAHVVGAQATASFDHSTCQYPDRVSNPVDGCDNSDPACPEITKGATSCPSDKDKEPTECPDGYFWRGGCVRVTGCPYGDSIPLGPECDKHAPQVQAAVTVDPVDEPIVEMQGK